MGERNAPWTAISADVSEFAGEEVTVTFEAADGATLSAEYVGVLADSTGSGLPDAVEELDLHMPPIGEGRYLFSELNLDPTVADTDDDGLRDGAELDRELEQFLEETGVYTNKSEFIKESVRRQLLQLNNEPAIAALRVEQLLARAETAGTTDAELDDRLDELRTRVDDDALADAVDAAREETARQYDDRT